MPKIDIIPQRNFSFVLFRLIRSALSVLNKFISFYASSIIVFHPIIAENKFLSLEYNFIHEISSIQGSFIIFFLASYAFHSIFLRYISE